MVDLITSPDSIMQILKRTGAFRQGHFVYPSGKYSPHYFLMPLAFRYYDTARVLAVALSRKFRLERDISSQLPKVAIISPSSGGIPVAFGVRDALSAEQIYWAEQEGGKAGFVGSTLWPLSDRAILSPPRSKVRTVTGFPSKLFNSKSGAISPTSGINQCSSSSKITSELIVVLDNVRLTFFE